MACLLIAAGAAPLHAQPVELLPDAIVLPDDLNDTDLDVFTLPGRLLLRISTATANVGAGPVEIRGGPPTGSTTQQVLQRIYSDDGSFRDRGAGEFLFHPTHGHVHFEAWTQLRLRVVLPDGGVGPVVASGEKTSFCLLDLRVHDPGNPAFPPGGAYNLCDTTVQGISPGWADVYDLFLPEQWIDVTGVPQGFYWIEAEVDPDDRLLESDETNNVARTLVALGPPPPGEPDAYEDNDSFDQVDALPEGAPFSANLGVVQERLVIPGLSMLDAFDVFRIRLLGTGGPEHFVRIESPFMEGDIDLFLFDESRTPLDGSFSSTNTEQISLDGIPPGVYYVRVSRFFGEVPDYTLIIEAAGNLPPSIEVLEPAPPTLWVEQALETVPVHWIAEDPESQPVQVSLSIDADMAKDKETLPLPGYQALPGSPGVAHLLTAGIEVGEWHLLARASDGAGEAEAWAPGTFVVYVKGDLNFDGHLDRLDLRFALRARHMRTGWRILLDMDRDGRLTRRDLLLFIFGALFPDGVPGHGRGHGGGHGHH